MTFPFPPPLPLVATQSAVYWGLIAVTLTCLIYYIGSRTAKWPVFVFTMSLAAGWLVTGSLPAPLPETVDRISVWCIINSLVCVVGLAMAFFRCVRMPNVEIVLLTAIGVIFVLLFPAIDRPKKAARRMQCLNNLHNISVAMQIYASGNDGRLPSAGFHSADLSWRVEVLPLLDYAALYRAYQRGKPWNDPANDEYAKMLLPVYACPSNPVRTTSQGHCYTSYALMTGTGTAFNGPNSLTLDEVGRAGGLSQKVLIVEACGAKIVWNEPRDIDITRDPVGINLPGKTPGSSSGWLSSYHRNVVNVAFADSSVKSLSVDTDPKVLKAMMTMDPADQRAVVP